MRNPSLAMVDHATWLALLPTTPWCYDLTIPILARSTTMHFRFYRLQVPRYVLAIAITLSLCACVSARQSRAAETLCPVRVAMPDFAVLSAGSLVLDSQDIGAVVAEASEIVAARRAEVLELFHAEAAEGVAEAEDLRAFLDQYVYVDAPLLRVDATGFRFHRDFVLAIAGYALENGRRDLAVQWLQFVDPFDTMIATFESCAADSFAP